MNKPSRITLNSNNMIRASLPLLSLGEDTTMNSLQSKSPTKNKSIKLATQNGRIEEKYKAIIIMHNKVQERLSYFERII